MNAPVRTILVAICLVFIGRECDAQWKIIAANRVATFPGVYANPHLGAIHYKAGVLWAGWADLWFSNTMGTSWQKSNLNLQSNIITDINFFDQFNGVVTTINEETMPNAAQGVYLTRDGGQTWKQILSFLHCTQVVFDGSPNTIHVLSQGDFPAPKGMLFTSVDGGTTWTSSTPGGLYSLSFTIALDHTIYCLNQGDASGNLGGFVSYSNDNGVTWNQNLAEVDGDSYSICADSCDAKRLYAANEDYLATVNNLSDLYYSPDGAKTWTSAVAFATPYLAGGMTCTANAIYASSLESGIYRSTDRGLTWKDIGGPVRPNASMAFDSRNIACVNDDYVFLLDDQGNIWETQNSGGDSLAITPGLIDLVLTQNSMFTTDSLLVCDSMLTRFLSYTPVGCNPPTLTKAQLVGADTLSYTILPTGGDSLAINFKPLFENLNGAQVLLTLSNGVQKTVTLQGYGIPRVPLVLITADQTVDTLGGSVVIGFTLNGAHKPEDITMVVHYDTVLDYNGSFSPTGVKLDIAGEQWKGRSKLLIPNVIENTTIGYSHFNVFNDSVPSQHVTFDSVTVLSAIAQCQYLSPAEASSTISPLTGCGVISISRYLHHSDIPQFALTPNPTSGDIFLTSSMSIGQVEITVYDMLGSQRTRSLVSLAKNTATKLSLPLGNGVYSVRVKSEAGTFDLRAVVNR